MNITASIDNSNRGDCLFIKTKEVHTIKNKYIFVDTMFSEKDFG